MHWPSWPSDSQAIVGARLAGRGVGQVGRRPLPCTATIVTSWPEPARGVEHEEREPAVAGDEAEAHRAGSGLDG